MCIRDSQNALLRAKRHAFRKLFQPGTGSVHGHSDLDQTDRCLLYTSDAADERSSVDLGGRRIIKKKNQGLFEGRSHNSKKRQHEAQ